MCKTLNGVKININQRIKMKVAIYTRVSTEKQDYENQLVDLREYCKKQEWHIYKEYTERVSGKESKRPVFKEMMLHAARKKFDGILVWALDRFSREGTAKVWHYFSLLEQYKVKFISYSEPQFNTDNEISRDILLTVMAVMAKQERIRISERTKAGLAVAKAKGVKLGKPEIPQRIKNQIVELREQGKSYRDICSEVFYWDGSRNKHYVSMGFVHKTLQDANTKILRNSATHSMFVK